MADKTLNDLFEETLKDIYYAEQKIVKTLPKLAKSAHDPKLQAAFEKHKEETENQIVRLESIFKMLNKPARGKTCKAIDGILAEGEEVLEMFKNTAAQDAGLVAAAQAVEHYEMSRYGALKTWAIRLGYKEAASLLEKTLKEESSTDENLTKLAESNINAAALKKVA